MTGYVNESEQSDASSEASSEASSNYLDLNTQSAVSHAQLEEAVGRYIAIRNLVPLNSIFLSETQKTLFNRLAQLPLDYAIIHKANAVENNVLRAIAVFFARTFCFLANHSFKIAIALWVCSVAIAGLVSLLSNIAVKGNESGTQIFVTEALIDAGVLGALFIGGLVLASTLKLLRGPKRPGLDQFDQFYDEINTMNPQPVDAKIVFDPKTDEDFQKAIQYPKNFVQKALAEQGHFLIDNGEYNGNGVGYTKVAVGVMQAAMKQFPFDFKTTEINRTEVSAPVELDSFESQSPEEPELTEEDPTQVTTTTERVKNVAMGGAQGGAYYQPGQGATRTNEQFYGGSNFALLAAVTASKPKPIDGGQLALQEVELQESPAQNAHGIQQKQVIEDLYHTPLLESFQQANKHEKQRAMKEGSDILAKPESLEPTQRDLGVRIVSEIMSLFDPKNAKGLASNLKKPGVDVTVLVQLLNGILPSHPLKTDNNTNLWSHTTNQSFVVLMMLRPKALEQGQWHNWKYWLATDERNTKAFGRLSRRKQVSLIFMLMSGNDQAKLVALSILQDPKLPLETLVKFLKSYIKSFEKLSDEIVSQAYMSLREVQPTPQLIGQFRDALYNTMRTHLFFLMQDVQGRIQEVLHADPILGAKLLSCLTDVLPDREIVHSMHQIKRSEIVPSKEHLVSNTRETVTARRESLDDGSAGFSKVNASRERVVNVLQHSLSDENNAQLLAYELFAVILADSSLRHLLPNSLSEGLALLNNQRELAEWCKKNLTNYINDGIGALLPLGPFSAAIYRAAQYYNVEIYRFSEEKSDASNAATQISLFNLQVTEPSQPNGQTIRILFIGDGYEGINNPVFWRRIYSQMELEVLSNQDPLQNDALSEETAHPMAQRACEVLAASDRLTQEAMLSSLNRMPAPYGRYFSQLVPVDYSAIKQGLQQENGSLTFLLYMMSENEAAAFNLLSSLLKEVLHSGVYISKVTDFFYTHFNFLDMPSGMISLVEKFKDHLSGNSSVVSARFALSVMAAIYKQVHSASTELLNLAHPLVYRRAEMMIETLKTLYPSTNLKDIFIQLYQACPDETVRQHLFEMMSLINSCVMERFNFEKTEHRNALANLVLFKTTQTDKNPLSSGGGPAFVKAGLLLDDHFLRSLAENLVDESKRVATAQCLGVIVWASPRSYLMLEPLVANYSRLLSDVAHDANQKNTVFLALLYHLYQGAQHQQSNNDVRKLYWDQMCSVLDAYLIGLGNNPAEQIPDFAALNENLDLLKLLNLANPNDQRSPQTLESIYISIATFLCVNGSATAATQDKALEYLAKLLNNRSRAVLSSEDGVDLTQLLSKLVKAGQFLDLSKPNNKHATLILRVVERSFDVMNKVPTSESRLSRAGFYDCCYMIGNGSVAAGYEELNKIHRQLRASDEAKQKMKVLLVVEFFAQREDRTERDMGFMDMLFHRKPAEAMRNFARELESILKLIDPAFDRTGDLTAFLGKDSFIWQRFSEVASEPQVVTDIQRWYENYNTKYLHKEAQVTESTGLLAV